jgi:ABC-type antimicrobial peptide transport system permease subunit
MKLIIYIRSFNNKLVQPERKKVFGKSIRLFNLLGFEVKVDFSWIIIALLIAWSLSTGMFPCNKRSRLMVVEGK